MTQASHVAAVDQAMTSRMSARAFTQQAVSRELITEQLQRISQGEPPLSPSIARKVIKYFASQNLPLTNAMPAVSLTERETEVLLRVAKGFTLPEIGVQLGLSRHTIADYVKQIYRKLNVSSRAEAALEAQRLGLFRR